MRNKKIIELGEKKHNGSISKKMSEKSNYSQVPIKQAGPNKRVGWIFIKYFCLSLCLFLSSCFFGAK